MGLEQKEPRPGVFLTGFLGCRVSTGWEAVGAPPPEQGLCQQNFCVFLLRSVLSLCVCWAVSLLVICRSPSYTPAVS